MTRSWSTSAPPAVATQRRIEHFHRGHDETPLVKFKRAEQHITADPSVRDRLQHPVLPGAQGVEPRRFSRGNSALLGRSDGPRVERVGVVGVLECGGTGR